MAESWPDIVILEIGEVILALLQFSVLVMVRRVAFRKTKKKAKKICLFSFFRVII